MTPTSTSPALAFGRHNARVFRSVGEATDEAARLIPNLIDWRYAHRDRFRFETSSVRLNDLMLAAMVSSQSHLRVGHRPEPTVSIHLAGRSQFCVDGRSVDICAGATAGFIPTSWPSDIKGDDRSVVLARIDSVRLAQTADTMLGLSLKDSQAYAPQDPHEIALHHGKLSFDAIFRNLFAQIDLYLDSPEMLAISGLDDAFYRTLVIAMSPQAFAGQSLTSVPTVNKKQLDRVCEWVIANIGNKITLTDLERLAHMSRRTLHNAFMRTFGISPMNWVRDQRLMAARARLQSPYARSVTDALYANGFTNASLFSAQYRERFGESPSATFARSRK